MSVETGEVSEPAPERSPARRSSSPTRSRSSPWARAGAVVVGTRLVFMTVAFAASYFLSPETQGTPPRGFFEIWVNGDASVFLTIAERGYDSVASATDALAFFPLFPLAVRALTALGAGGAVAGVLVSALASWVALAYLYRLAEARRPTTGDPALLYLALWPAAFLLIAPYGESLFLAGAVAAFYYARRSRWHLVALPAAIAMASSFAGVFLLAGLAVEFLSRRHLRDAAVGMEWGYVTYMALALSVAAFGPDYASVPRILAIFFPVVLWIADVTRVRPRLHEIHLVTTTALMTVGVAVYTRGEWLF